MAKKVKPLALGVVRRGSHFLLGEGRDPETRQPFFRPIGGRIEFGERATETIVREFEEELGVVVHSPRQLGLLENIFRYDGKRRHELVLMFEVSLKDEALYQREVFARLDREGRASWRHLDELKAAQLYPVGLLSLLRGG